MAHPTITQESLLGVYLCEHIVFHVVTSLQMGLSVVLFPCLSSQLCVQESTEKSKLEGLDGWLRMANVPRNGHMAGQNLYETQDVGNKLS